MEIDTKPTDLECVDDDFEEGAHEKLDEEIRALFRPTPQNSDLLSPYLLIHIVEQSGSRLLANYLIFTECKTIIKSEPRLRNMLLDGLTNGYKSVRLLKLLRPESAFSDLECVEDDFEEGAHEKLDRNIRAVFRFTPEYFDELLPMVLSAIVFKSGGRLLAKYTNGSECETIIKNEPRLRNMLLDGWTNGYKSVRLLKLLRPKESVFEHDDGLGCAPDVYRAWAPPQLQRKPGRIIGYEWHI